MSSNLSTLTFLGHDPEAWVCTRCGLVEQGPFTRMHRPANSDKRTCGGIAVPARLYFEVRELIFRAWVRWAKTIGDLESGKLPPEYQNRSGAYGLWQIIRSMANTKFNEEG